MGFKFQEWGVKEGKNNKTRKGNRKYQGWSWIAMLMES